MCVPVDSHNVDPDRRCGEEPTLWRFLAGIIGLFVACVLLLYALKSPFVVAYWSQLTAAGKRQIARGLLIGLRFSGSAAAMLLGAALLIWYLLAVIRRPAVKRLLYAYVALVAFLIPVVVIADFLYFQESGKHFTYEATAYLGTASLPMIRGAFEMHPLPLFLALLACIALATGAGLATRRLVRACVPDDDRPRPKWLLTAPILFGLGLLCLRGGIGKFNMTIGDAVIAADPYVNALCLDPVYAVLRTALSPEQSFKFGSEEDNIRTVRGLVGLGESEPISRQYPLLRESPGTAQGNRMNVVIFLLESWSGKDIGCLGGVAKVTPFFDELASQGTLFKNAHATGIRTAEGVFTILCSFPNQPIKPIMNRYSVLQNRWRSLSQILQEAGYQNLFIHGRDLDFDHLRNFLWSAHFHRIIDRHDFPVSATLANDSWPGAHDGDVLCRADAEFAAITDQPFFGVIYTMNTHPPFAVPEGFPPARPPDSDSNLFLNSLNYTDHALRVFFDRAKTHDYFRNTVFILISDHARTRGFFTLATQHHIALLFYSPGHVPARATWAVASQIDILPTVLALLQLKTRHASWGRDLMTLQDDEGFAVSMAGSETRWRTREYLLNDGLTDAQPMLFDLTADADCRRNAWDKSPAVGEDLKTKLRSYLSLSQALLNQNRAFPGPGE